MTPNETPPNEKVRVHVKANSNTGLISIDELNEKTVTNRSFSTSDLCHSKLVLDEKRKQEELDRVFLRSRNISQPDMTATQEVLADCSYKQAVKRMDALAI